MSKEKESKKAEKLTEVALDVTSIRGHGTKNEFKHGSRTQHGVIDDSILSSINKKTSFTKDEVMKKAVEQGVSLTSSRYDGHLIHMQTMHSIKFFKNDKGRILCKKAS